MADAEVAPKYRHSFAAGIGAALAAGLVAAIADMVLTAGHGKFTGELIGITLGLYALPSLVMGVAIGAVAGAWQQTYGPGSFSGVFRRLRADRDLDKIVCGAVLAGAVIAVVFVAFSTVAAMKLVAGVERKSVGAVLLGLVLVAALPLLAVGGLPVYRVTRRIAAFVPRLGPIPATLTLIGAATIGGVALLVFFIFTRLEWRALHLGAYALLAAYPLIILAWVGLWYGSLDKVRRRIPRRGMIALVAAGIALILPFITLQGTPGDDTAVALSEHSKVARMLMNTGRGLLDADGDGYSSFLGGPDCDDSNANVHPDAREVPNNGIDDNCVGGDRTVTPKTDPEPVAAAPEATGFEFDGNLLFVMVDTLRADRMGYMGYKRDGKSLTPRLDALAKDSVYFTGTFAQGPNTPRSWPSIITSMYPSQVSVNSHFKNFSKVLDDNVTMFEALRDAGIYTASYSSHFYYNEVRNVNQGFDVYDNDGAKDVAGSNHDIASPRIVAKAQAKLAELAASKQRFAMFVHLFEPHSTYMKHDDVNPDWKITTRGTASLKQKYDFEIAFQDQWLGTLLDSLTEHGLQDNTMVVIMSDHGEAFGVHFAAGKAMFFHGQTLYEELLRVPMLMSIPGVEPTAVDDVVELIDVAPTILEAMGVDRPAAFRGRSLLSRMLGEAELPQKAAFAELLPSPGWDHSAKSMITGDGRYHLYYRTSDKRFELYDLVDDPEEKTNLWNKDKELSARLKDQLVEWIEVDLQP